MTIAERKRTKRFPLQARRVTVTELKDLAPNYRQIRFGGDDLGTFESGAPEDHVKLFIPDPGEAAPRMPTYGPDGVTMPGNAPWPVMRDYTPRSFDPATGELVIEFALHADGPATDWARNATPGDKLGMAGPRGSHLVDGPFDWHLLIGDETMLPSIARRLEEAEGGQYLVFIEVEGPENELSIWTDADVGIHWVHRSTGATLLNALRAATFPEGESFTWAGGEATALRDIRRHLINECGFDREWLSFSGHWKQGVAEFDHHQPMED